MVPAYFAFRRRAADRLLGVSEGGEREGRRTSESVAGRRQVHQRRSVSSAEPLVESRPLNALFFQTRLILHPPLWRSKHACLARTFEMDQSVIVVFQALIWAWIAEGVGGEEEASRAWVM